ncbi:TetR/AcrR family transcriptional regulator [Pseudonocardia sp. S2-4]|uniref:TetR/AcrR family transcriptional regulator n=1 Tax=Pseudonocardia humida TaxID=2800819 RepID=A0ABT1A818_9PSEU|nr:TetR/AcrR family transcriptional regulator [Pseudonocardia humida]
MSARDWVDAAVAALGEGGVAAVAVEPLATRLGTTKGSFYWHFANRDALLTAALESWERTDTEEVIALVAAEPDPRTRLHTLLTLAVGGRHDDHGEQPGGRVELALLATRDHPLVAPVLARVTARRIDYLAQLFARMGLPPSDARHRGLLAYSAYLGHAQLTQATPDAVPTGADLAAYIDATITRLTGDRG